MPERKPSRFEIRLPPELGDQIDDWRREQSDLPTRAEAARRLIEVGLSAAGKSGPSGGSGGGGKTDTPPKPPSPPEKPKPASRSSAPSAPLSKEAQLRTLRESRA
jgi:hypothetical protein